MKKILMSTAIAAMLLATSCQNEEIISSQSTGSVTVNASTMVESRTYVQGQTVYWSEGDKLFAFGGEVSGTLTLQGKGESTNGTFSGFVSGDPDNLKGIVYPAEMVQYQNGKVTINIGEIDAENSNAPMFAGFGSNINFTHLAAMVRIQINDVPATGNDLTIRGTGIGQITIDAEGKITYSQSPETITVTGLKQGTNEICFPVFTKNVDAAGVVALQLAIGDGTRVPVNIPLKAQALSVNEVPVLTYNPNSETLTEETTLPEGENVDEYLISTTTELIQFANLVNKGEDYFQGKTVKLGADIDLYNQQWTPIGSATLDHGFMGNFDGNGYTIKNLNITNITPDADGNVYAGLFGVTEGTNANENYIKNLTIENVNIDLEGHIVAAAIAYPYYTTLENIKVKGNVTIKGGDYTSGVLAYTRRCVNAKEITIEGNEGSSIQGLSTVGGVISDIQMNGGLTANYSNFAASGLTIKGNTCVGGISGIISNQTLDGATVKSVTIVGGDARTGIVAGALGDESTITNVSHENVTGATRIIGATYDKGYYVGQIVEAEGQKAVIYTIEDGVKAVSVAELNLNGKNWQSAMDWAAGLGEGWALASMEDLNKIYDLRFELNDVLEADNAENALFWEGDEYYKKNGSVYYALYMSSTEVKAGELDPNGVAYLEREVFVKYFNLLGYRDYLYSSIDCVDKRTPCRDNYFARAVYTMK